MTLNPIVLILLFSLISCYQKSELVDVDGNSYQTKLYGERLWMTENLKVFKDRSGSPVSYFIPGDDTSNISNFGLLYDFETACNVCPNGWSLPTKEDWTELLQLEVENSASRFKDQGYWGKEDNTNISQFSIRPAGFGNNEEHHNEFKNKTLFWSSSKEDEHFIWTVILGLDKDAIRMASQHPTYAFSVRCIKNK